jgi:hypothetical protein
MNNYLVGLYRWDTDTDKYIYHTDCILKLSVTGAFELSGDIDKNTFIKNGDFSDKNTCIINNVKNVNNRYDVEIYLRADRLGIRFDRSSSAAYNAFMKQYYKIKEDDSGASYYENGKIKCAGNLLHGKFTGHCVEYHNNAHNTVKWIGEMEDGVYDGSGVFFSECGLIKVCANNICNGVPNGVGKLYVCGELIQTFKFKDLDKIDTSSVDYCNKILQQVRKDHEVIYREGKFNAVDPEEKVNYLFSIITHMSDELEKTKSRLGDVEAHLRKSWRIF